MTDQAGAAGKNVMCLKTLFSLLNELFCLCVLKCS